MSFSSLRTHSSSREPHKTYKVNTEAATQHGWYLGLHLRSVEQTDSLFFEFFQHYRFRCNELLASVEVPISDLAGESQVMKRMDVHRKRLTSGSDGLRLLISWSRCPSNQMSRDDSMRIPAYQENEHFEAHPEGMQMPRLIHATTAQSLDFGSAGTRDTSPTLTPRKELVSNTIQKYDNAPSASHAPRDNGLHKAQGVQPSIQERRISNAAKFQSQEPLAESDGKSHPRGKALPHLPHLDTEMRKVARRIDTIDIVVTSVEPIMEFLDNLSEIHDIARAAWFAVSGIYQVVKALNNQDQEIVALYQTMLEAYQIAQENEALNQGGHFSELFGRIVKQSEECYVFLSKYCSKNRMAQILDRWDAPGKIKKFTEAFKMLRDEFTDTQIKTTTVLALDNQRNMTTLALKGRIEPLRPPRMPLGPKSHCLSGTRRESVKNIMDWIFRGDERESVLWISGIAGVGKSSLIGTLHNTLADLGFSSRLAAFIRFDRSDYNDARYFISSLAYLLANFDEKFAGPIADAISGNPQIVQSTDLSAQMQRLLLDPLRRLGKEIDREGRVVVLVDGIDECTRSDRTETDFRGQLLELFAKNKFALLPFLRIVIASRPEQDVKDHFRRSHIRHFVIETSSSETVKDIAYFFKKKLQALTPFNGLNEERKDKALDLLPSRAGGLFIWASTAVSFIGDNVEERLEVFTTMEPPKSALLALISLYETALNSLAHDVHGGGDLKENILLVLGLIMASRQIEQVPSRPLTIQILHDLVQNSGSLFKKVDVKLMVSKLGSLLYEGEDKGLRIIHKSFEDFLTMDPSQLWYVDRVQYKKYMACATIACVTGHLEGSDPELEEACRSSEVFRYATIQWPRYYASLRSEHIEQKDILYCSLRKMMVQHIIRWIHSVTVSLQRGEAEKICCRTKKDHTMSAWLTDILWESQADQHDNFFDSLCVKAQRFLSDEIPGVFTCIKGVFECLLEECFVAGSVYKTERDGQESVIYPVENIFGSVFVHMADGSHVGEDIFSIIEKKSWPPAVLLSPKNVSVMEINFRHDLKWVSSRTDNE
ncbi:nacht wd40 domain-containing protein [Moniliophthora roreri MCA 2997]|uniref:Nacht wd40 domain-containing protein n=1 Tax=Moniliophthora roreri (strain MCA 2997) TaxID=1381753 RepID=V2X4F4_MONRO|nr:nacht wd40 domain-containing protein [Moniliophthora roreri MCA 2997]